MQMKLLITSILLGTAMVTQGALGDDDSNAIRYQAMTRLQTVVEQNIEVLIRMEELVDGNARFDIEQVRDADKELLKEITESEVADTDLQVISQDMAQTMSKNTQVLTALLNKVPEQALQGLQRAIEVSSHGEKVANETLESIAKGETPRRPVVGQPNRPERPDHPERPDRPDRPDRPGRP